MSLAFMAGNQQKTSQPKGGDKKMQLSQKKSCLGEDSWIDSSWLDCPDCYRRIHAAYGANASVTTTGIMAATQTYESWYLVQAYAY